MIYALGISAILLTGYALLGGRKNASFWQVAYSVFIFPVAFFIYMLMQLDINPARQLLGMILLIIASILEFSFAINSRHRGENILSVFMFVLAGLGLLISTLNIFNVFRFLLKL